MRFSQSFKLAFKSMAGSKVRTMLTMLGIIIGVAAVIILVSLVGGFSKEMTDSFSSLGSTTLNVMLFGRGGNVEVDPDELMAFTEQHADLYLNCSPVVGVGGAVVKKGSSNISSTVTGGSESYHLLNTFTVENGRALSYADLQRRAKTAVIGTYVAQELFSGDPIGQDFRINGEKFTVVGTLEQKGDGGEHSDDNTVIIPYTSAQRLSNNARVTNYRLSASDITTVERAKTELETFLADRMGGTDYFYVLSVSQVLDAIDQLTGTLTTVLVGIAGISLLVGGVGIMNIMLVSVTERTKEIGIRKSLGGKKRDILLQFVIEAATTSAVGGVIGILLGCGASIPLASAMGIHSFISAPAVIVAFSVSVGIGILFGYYPAAQAARLNPIDALRFE
ncbi:MAG: FtsX-like permease family protein [Clostridiales bacterium]|nr:FtsX-like permease family protein [Clostridiales bacterium]